MLKDVLKYLRCPQCKHELVLVSKAGKVYPIEEVYDGLLSCSACKRIFPITNGIPRFVEKQNDLVEQTRSSFGKKWNKVSNYGFDKVTKKFHLDWFMERFGFKNKSDLKAYLKTKEFILDAGCGTGRLSNQLAELCGGHIFALDISDSVDVAASRLKDKDVTVIQADLNHLPFAYAFFDLIVCDMVIHHTPKPRESYKHLAMHLDSMGHLLCYVYKKKGVAREFSDDRLREFTTKMSFEECLKFSQIVTKFGKELSEFDPKLQRVVYWEIFKCFWNMSHGWDYSVITNFDWYHPHYAYRYDVQDVKEWTAENYLKLRWLFEGDSGTSWIGEEAKR